MFNASGFVTPGSLDGQSVQNRLRMASSLINSLAGTVENDSDNSEAASQALTIIASYANTAGEARQNAKNEAIRRQYEALLAAGKVEPVKARR